MVPYRFRHPSMSPECHVAATIGCVRVAFDGPQHRRSWYPRRTNATKSRSEELQGVREETFDLPEHVVVVGPNNCGKTSLLQAVATWSEIANHWFETNPDFARADDGNYPAAELNLLLFNAVPLPDFPHLWQNKILAEPVCVWLETDDWRVGFEVVYSAMQLAHVRPARDVTEANLEKCKKRPLTVVYVPPVSQLDTTEPPLSEYGVRARLRRGRVAKVLRNVLVSISADNHKWDCLQALVREFFGYELLRPSVGNNVLAQYRHRADGQAYDLGVAASGFLQVLATYAALLYDRASVILIDEPDAHLHLLLQETAYRKLREFAATADSQLVVATHSEVVIRKAHLEHLRLLWRGFRELGGERKIQDVLRLENEMLMLAETAPGILYVEGESDLANLRAWAQVLSHPMFDFLDKPLWRETASAKGGDSALKHFRALRKMVPEIKGFELRDGDRHTPKGGPRGLCRLRWQRREIENYLLHPPALERFVRQEAQEDQEAQEEGSDAAERAREYMKHNLPPALFEDSFDSANVVATMKGSDILSEILQAAGVQLRKTEYHRIAATMQPDEVHPEIRDKLDAMAAHFKIEAAAN